MSQSSEEEQNGKDVYIRSLVQKIYDNISVNEEIDLTMIYKTLIKKVKFYYNEFKMMEEDELWAKIVQKTEDCKEESRIMMLVNYHCLNVLLRL